jgi:hypothetical protein
MMPDSIVEQKSRIWDLIAEGVQLRDAGIRLRETDEWRAKCLEWLQRLLAAAGALEPDLARLLSPLGDLDPVDNSELVPHQKDIMAISTMLRILRARLPDIR